MPHKKSHRLYLVLVLAIVLMTAAAGAGTMAYFTSHSVNGTDNPISMGTLVIGGQNADQVLEPVNIENLYPGCDPISGQFIVKNRGSLPAKVYRMDCDFSGAVNTPADRQVDLAKVLNMQVYIDYGKAMQKLIYNGKFNLMTPEHGVIYFDPVILVNTGDQKTITTLVSMDSTAGNDYQGLKLDQVKFSVHAKQVEDLIAGEESGNTWHSTVLGSTAHFQVKVGEGSVFGHQLAIEVDPTDSSLYPDNYPNTFTRTDKIHITKRTPDGAEVELGWALVKWRRVWIFRDAVYQAQWQVDGVDDNLGDNVRVLPLPVQGIAVFDGLENGSYAIKTDISYSDSLGKNFNETTGWLQYLYNYNE